MSLKLCPQGFSTPNFSVDILASVIINEVKPIFIEVAPETQNKLKFKPEFILYTTYDPFFSFFLSK